MFPISSSPRVPSHPPRFQGLSFNPDDIDYQIQTWESEGGAVPPDVVEFTPQSLPVPVVAHTPEKAEGAKKSLGMRLVGAFKAIGRKVKSLFK